MTKNQCLQDNKLNSWFFTFSCGLLQPISEQRHKLTLVIIKYFHNFVAALIYILIFHYMLIKNKGILSKLQNPAINI